MNAVHTTTGQPVTNGSVTALGPDARVFFAAQGYTLARLARRCRVHPSTMVLFFQGRFSSRPLVRKLTKLRAQLETRARDAAAHGIAHLGGPEYGAER